MDLKAAGFRTLAQSSNPKPALKPGCGVNCDRAAAAHLGFAPCLWKCVCFFGVFFCAFAVWKCAEPLATSQKCVFYQDFEVQCVKSTGRGGIFATHCLSISR